MQFVWYPQDAAAKMIEDVQLCFEALLNNVNLAQKRAISFIEAERTRALQNIQQLEDQMDSRMLSISQIMNKLDECRCNHSYFNFLQVSV